jgi:hypothetical protein
MVKRKKQFVTERATPNWGDILAFAWRFFVTGMTVSGFYKQRA